jgi:hypothetical protein
MLERGAAGTVRLNLAGIVELVTVIALSAGFINGGKHEFLV